jgi:hypothetical protein
MHQAFTKETLTMRRVLIAILTVLGIVLLPGTAQAAVVFHSGPTFTDLGTTLNVTGNVSGLGNGDLTAQITATGVADVTCTNPAGNVAPGQRTNVTTSGTQSGIEVKNGRATFDVTTAEPGPLDPAVVCPNRKWTATITDVHFTSATLTLIQGGVVIFRQTYQL